MNSIFYIQYNPNTYYLTKITSNNKSNDNNWIPVAISHVYQEYTKNNYTSIQYDPSNQRLIYPDEAARETNISNNTQNTINDVINQQNNNSKILSALKYKVSWNHVVGIYSLLDDSPFLNKTYGIPMPNGQLNIADYAQTGIYTVPNGDLKPNDGPKGINFQEGYTFKTYQINSACLIATFINQDGEWMASFNPHVGIKQDWKEIVSF